MRPASYTRAMTKAVAKVAGVTIMPPGQDKGFNAHFKPVGRGGHQFPLGKCGDLRIISWSLR